MVKAEAQREDGELAIHKNRFNSVLRVMLKHAQNATEAQDE